LKTIISNKIKKVMTLLNPLRGSGLTLLPYPALRTGKPRSRFKSANPDPDYSAIFYWVFILVQVV